MPRALIVEDSPVFQSALSEAINRYCPGVEITMAVDTHAAWKEIEAGRFDVAFVDVELPGESGLSLTRGMTQRCPSTIKIVMTAYDFPEYREAAFANGANYFIPKEARNELEVLFRSLPFCDWGGENSSDALTC